MSGYAKIAKIVREVRKKRYSNLKAAAPQLGMGDRKLWKIENGIAYLSPEDVVHLGKTIDKRIPIIYANEICPNREFCHCNKPIEPQKLAESVIAFQQTYKKINETVFEVLPNVAEDGRIAMDEITVSRESLEQLKKLIFRAECLKLRIELEIEKRKTVFAETA